MATTESEDDLITRIQPGHLCCANCYAFIDGDCRINPPKVFWDHEDNAPITVWPSPEPSAFCLQHKPMGNA